MELQTTIGYLVVFIATVLALFIVGYLIYRLAPFSLASVSATAIIQFYIPSLALPQLKEASTPSRYFLASIFAITLITTSVVVDALQFKIRFAKIKEEIKDMIARIE